MLTPQQADRYARQVLFRPIGAEGQARLLQSTVVVAGVGAIGCVAADMLARCGIGHLHLIDCDRVDTSNLQRQTLYTEADVASGRPKAELAAERLRQVNSGIEICAQVARLEAENAAALVAGAEVIIDAVDNFRAKFALNQAAVALGIPLMYGALSGSLGMTMPIIPGETGCLCCLYCAEPDAGSSETAATAGVIPPVVATIAGLQVTQALKLLVGARGEVLEGVAHFDAWDGELTVWPASRRPDCEICGSCGK